MTILYALLLLLAVVLVTTITPLYDLLYSYSINMVKVSMPIKVHVLV